MLINTGGVGAEEGSIGRNVRIRPADSIVEALGGIQINVELGVVRVWWVGNGEVFCYGKLLVPRLRVIVGESSGGREIHSAPAEVYMHDTLAVFDCLVGVEHGAANRSDVRAVSWILRVEDLAFRAKTTGAIETFSGERGNTIVTGSSKDRVTLEAEFHEFIALAL